MVVYLTSDNAQTQTLCREVLTEVLGHRSRLRRGTLPLQNVEADLYLWNIFPEPGSFEHNVSEDVWRHFFLHRPDERRSPSAKRTSVAHQNPAEAGFPSGCDGFPCERLRARLCCRAPVHPGLARHPGRDAAGAIADESEVFLARAIHDLRAPLTAITGYCGCFSERMSAP